MNATWIVSANAGRARFFSQLHAAAPLEEIKDMVNDGARLRTSESESDQLGQRSASKSRHSVGAPTQPNGYQPNQLPVEHQAELFARDVADFLVKGRRDGSFQHLLLAASPEFLGVLRKQLNSNLESLVSLEINKDYTHCNARELRDQIKAHQAKV